MWMKILVALHRLRLLKIDSVLLLILYALKSLFCCGCLIAHSAHLGRNFYLSVMKEPESHRCFKHLEPNLFLHQLNLIDRIPKERFNLKWSIAIIDLCFFSSTSLSSYKVRLLKREEQLLAKTFQTEANRPVDSTWDLDQAQKAIACSKAVVGIPRPAAFLLLLGAFNPLPPLKQLPRLLIRFQHLPPPFHLSLPRHLLDPQPPSLRLRQ